MVIRDFWEKFSRYFYGKHEITNDTHIIINGDGAPWICSGVDYFPSAIYTYDRYHLKPWIKTAFSKRSKKEIERAYTADDKNDPVSLVTAIGYAQKSDTNDKKKAELMDKGK